MFTVIFYALLLALLVGGIMALIELVDGGYPMEILRAGIQASIVTLVVEVVSALAFLILYGMANAALNM